MHTIGNCRVMCMLLTLCLRYQCGLRLLGNKHFLTFSVTVVSHFYLRKASPSQPGLILAAQQVQGLPALKQKSLNNIKFALHFSQGDS